MNIEQLLESAQNYFIGEMLQGNYTAKDWYEFHLTIKMKNSDHTFILWVYSERSLGLFESMGNDSANPVKLCFNSKEKKVLFKIFKQQMEALQLQEFKNRTKETIKTWHNDNK